MNNTSLISIKSIALRNTVKRTNNELSSGNSTCSNVHAGGDQYFRSALNRVKSKQIRHWSISKRQGDADNYSSDSLKVNIGDLADAEELEKIAQIFTIHQKQKDSSSFVEQRSNNLIEDLHILNGFRIHSQEILTILSQKDMASNLFNYGEYDTGRRLLSIAAEVDWYEGVLFLLNRGVNINETDRENRTALIDCLTSINTNIMIALVQKPECNLDIQTVTGHTAAHYAVMMNKIPFLEILIKSGARLDLRNDKGENVLHQILEYQRKECWKIVKHFYKNHSHYLKHLINTETYEHKTCLTIAFEHRPNIYFFKELLPI